MYQTYFPYEYVNDLWTIYKAIITPIVHHAQLWIKKINTVLVKNILEASYVLNSLS